MRFSWLAVSLMAAKRHNVTPATSGPPPLTKRRQFHQIILRHRLERFPGPAPGRESADDHERVESFCPQHVRHPGAGRFACSSTVETDVLVLRQVFDLFLKSIGLDANRVLDS